MVCAYIPFFSYSMFNDFSLEERGFYIVSDPLKNKYICSEYKNAHSAYPTYSLRIIFLLFYS